MTHVLYGELHLLSMSRRIDRQWKREIHSYMHARSTGSAVQMRLHQSAAIVWYCSSCTEPTCSEWPVFAINQSKLIGVGSTLHRSPSNTVFLMIYWTAALVQRQVTRTLAIINVGLHVVLMQMYERSCNFNASVGDLSMLSRYSVYNE